MAKKMPAYRGEVYEEVRQLSNGKWQVFVLPGANSGNGLCFASLKDALSYRLYSCPLVVKTNSPDYRDYELVWTPQDGFLFDDDDFFRMQLDVSTEEFFK